MPKGIASGGPLTGQSLDEISANWWNKYNTNLGQYRWFADLGCWIYEENKAHAAGEGE